MTATPRKPARSARSKKTPSSASRSSRRRSAAPAPPPPAPPPPFSAPAKKSRKGEPHDPDELVRRTRAKLPPLDLAPIKAATTFDERALAAARMLAAGRWDLATVDEVRIAWGVTEAAMATYRRTGRTALAVLQDVDMAKDLELVKANLRHQADEALALALRLEATNRLTLASRYRDIARKAEEDYARFAGLDVQRHSISLEADPRIAGLWTAILAALEDLDRMREAYVGEVEKLAGGVVPTAPLPPAGPFVRDAVRRYEGEIGARKLAA